MDKDIKTDALQEVMNIGTGQAASALSQMLGQKVLINIPDIRLVPVEKVTEQLGGANEMVVSTYFQITGDLGGRILIVLDRKDAYKLASQLIGEEITETRLSDVNQSSIMELGNIIANNYLNALAGLLDMKLYPSTPYIAEDMLGAVIDFLLIELAEMSDHALLVTTEMSVEQQNVKGSFLVFPDETFLNRIFEKLGIN